MSALQEVDHESADCFEIRRLHLYLFFQPSDRKYNGKKAETALSFLSLKLSQHVSDSVIAFAPPTQMWEIQQ